MHRGLGYLPALVIVGQAALGAEDLGEIKTRGVLRAIVAMDGLPEGASLKPGTAPGMEREMIEGFAGLQRLRVEFVPVPTGSDRIPALLAGKGDVIIGSLVVTESRRKQVDFSAEVFPGRSVVVTYQPHPLVESLEQLRKERVGTMKGSSWAEQVATSGVPPDRVDDSFSTPDQVMQGLRTRKVSAIVMTLGWALLEKRKDAAVELGFLFPPSPGRAWGVRKEAPQLRQALDEYITNVRRTPTWSRLVVKYYGDLALEILKKSSAAP